MKKGSRKKFLLSLLMLAVFTMWTFLVCFVDVGAIGPRGSSVGLATLNSLFHELVGVNMLLYNVTDWLGLVPIAVALGFAVLGLFQWIKRKSIMKVDRSLLVLGAFYIAILAAYILFEMLSLNYRPVLIDGVLEASYPSSTTVLTLSVIPTAMMQADERIKNTPAKLIVLLLGFAFSAFMLIGRVLSGVHWISDIIGGALLGAGLALMYAFAAYEK